MDFAWYSYNFQFSSTPQVESAPKFDFRHLAKSIILYESYKRKLDFNNKLYFSQFNESKKLEMKRACKERWEYFCSYCHRCFSKAYNKKIHERTHTNERPFACSVCFKKFRRKDHLKDHMLLMEESKIESNVLLTCENETKNEENCEFFDDNIDTENSKWITENRTNTIPSNSISDGVLSCPMCMTTLCYDCQRHEIYQNQYRAMFVYNCDLKNDKIPIEKIESQDTKDTQDSSIFQYVMCECCDCHVAYYDKNQVYHFFNVIRGNEILQTVSKITKVVIVRLTNKNIYLIVPESVSNNSIQVWCELESNILFIDYKMAGLSLSDNEIYFEIAPENILSVFKSCKVDSVCMKLTYKFSTFLSFEFSMPIMDKNSNFIVHDIPISIIPKRLWSEYPEPNLPEFHCSIYLNDLKVLRNGVERLKKMSPYMKIMANRKGQFLMEIKNEIVCVCMKFDKLRQPLWNDYKYPQCSQNEHDDVDFFYTISVNPKPFYSFLSINQLNPTNVICSNL
ncbi:Checkpoint protein HUS1 [Intoshia linei]|uniref:Checkpoint protein HUS1 n=1 Tax=Intoshia linei TaxID=1819745 RepID=A0A177B0X4_9BILA|nr:Checkpoint protein HUS1 [Intoshia linei]